MVLSLSNVYIFLLDLYIASMKTKFINEWEDQYFIEREGLGNFAKKVMKNKIVQGERWGKIERVLSVIQVLFFNLKNSCTSCTQKIIHNLKMRGKKNKE